MVYKQFCFFFFIFILVEQNLSVEIQEPYSDRTVEAMNILWVPFEHWGRFNTGFGFVEELSKRGHNITAVISNLGKKWTEKEEISNHLTKIINLGNITDPIKKQAQAFGESKDMLSAIEALLESWNVYEYETTTNFYSFYDQNHKNLPNFDLILYDSATKHGINILYKLNITKAVQYTTLPPSMEIKTPTFINPASSGIGKNMSFSQRFKGVFQKLMYYLFGYYYFLSISPYHYDLNLEDKYSDLNRTFSLQIPKIFVYPFGLEYPFPTYPNQIVLGPSRSFKRENLPPLPSHLNDWMNESSDYPIIYIAMGTTARPPPQLMDLIANSFFLLKNQSSSSIQYKYRIIWAISEGNYIPDLIDNSFFFLKQSWVPQHSILADPRISLFWTHGGANSVVESLSFAKPILCSPVFIDQLDNCQRVHDNQAGIRLDFETADVNEVLSSIDKIIHDKSYHNNAKKLGRLFDLMKGAEKGADWIELIGEIGSDHLVAENLSYSIFKYYDLDLVFTFLGLFIIIIHFPILFCYCFFKKCCSKSKKIKVE